jgi:hypothetical protein
MFNSKEYQELTHNFKFMDNKYKGMTVNERLWASGLMAKFEKAIKKKMLLRQGGYLRKLNLLKRILTQF